MNEFVGGCHHLCAVCCHGNRENNPVGAHHQRHASVFGQLDPATPSRCIRCPWRVKLALLYLHFEMKAYGGGVKKGTMSSLGSSLRVEWMHADRYDRRFSCCTLMGRPVE